MIPTLAELREEELRVSDSIDQFVQRSTELITVILGWWQAHEFDCHSDEEGNEFNTYDNEPEFVEIAKELKLFDSRH